MIIVIVVAIYVSLSYFAVRRMPKRRLVLAFSLAPLAPCMLASASAGEILLALVFAPFAYLFALTGIPFYFLFRRLGWLRLWHVVSFSAFSWWRGSFCKWL
jgi:hypothetical protein